MQTQLSAKLIVWRGGKDFNLQKFRNLKLSEKTLLVKPLKKAREISKIGEFKSSKWYCKTGVGKVNKQENYCNYLLICTLLLYFSFSRKKQEKAKEVPAWSHPPGENAIVETVEIIYNSAIFQRDNAREDQETRIWYFKKSAILANSLKSAICVGYC